MAKMPETETRTTSNRGRPRKSVAALRKIARESNDDDEMLDANTKTPPPTSTKQSETEKKQNDQDTEEAAVGKLVEDVLDENEEDEEEEGGEGEEPDSNEQSEPEEQVEPPAFSLATLGLQRVGSAPPPKPKAQKAQILLLNARGMPARIRKRNPLFYDENIINDDKPLRVSLAPKKASNRGSGDSPGKMQTTPSKVLKKRKGVVSRYMRSNEGNAAPNSHSSGEVELTPGGKPKKLSGKHQMTSASASKAQLQQQGHLRPGRGASLGGTKRSAAAAAIAAAEDSARKAEASAVANKRLGLAIGQRLRNLLKLPKAHKWAIAEWFYSYIDKPLFDCKSEFMNHVSELAPRLGTRKLNRHEWVSIRRRMGRPRRCSAAFFDEERRELERKRQLMRTLQSRKPGEFKDSVLLSDMPEKIPMPLPLGTKVTARLRKPQDGIFAGTVAAYDSMNSEYRVTFERPGLSTQSIPDYEIVSENFHEMLPLHSFTKDFRPNLISIYQTNNLGYTTNLGFTTNLANCLHSKRNPLGAATAANLNNTQQQPQQPLITPQKNLANNNAAARNALSMKLNKSDPLLGQDAIGESPMRHQLVRHHGYSMKLLEHLVLLQNFIALKESKIERLAEMNSLAELAMAEESGEHNRQQLRINFQRRYASNIMSIERLNGDLGYALTKVQELSSSLTRNPNLQAMISPTLLREECRARASQTVDDMNSGVIKSERMVNLLKNLTTLLIVTQNLDSDWDAEEAKKVLDGCMEEVCSNLVCPKNADVFRKSVQEPIEQIAIVINRNVKERSYSQDKSATEPKTPKSDGAESGSEKSTPESLDSEKKKRKKSTSENEKSKQLAESDVEPMEMDSEPEDETTKPKEQKKPTDDDIEDDADLDASVDADADAEADAEVDADADADADGSDADGEKNDKATADKVEEHTDDTQITIESMKESDDESQSHDEKDDKIDMIKLMTAVGASDDSQEEFIFETNE